MATTNDITGDSLVSKSVSNAYRDNFDRTFGVRHKSTQDGQVAGANASNTDGTQSEPQDGATAK